MCSGPVDNIFSNYLFVRNKLVGLGKWFGPASDITVDEWENVMNSVLCTNSLCTDIGTNVKTNNERILTGTVASKSI